MFGIGSVFEWRVPTNTVLNHLQETREEELNYICFAGVSANWKLTTRNQSDTVVRIIGIFIQGAF